MKAMLPAERPVTDLPKLCADETYWMEQKADGQRMLVSVSTFGHVNFYNRNGEGSSKMHESGFFADMSQMGSFTFDGEFVSGNGDNTLWLFDVTSIVKHDGSVLIAPEDMYHVRRSALEMLFSKWDFPPSIRLLPAWRTELDKASQAETIRVMGGEGVVFKMVHGTYQEGSTAAHMSPEAIKVKFTKTIDCVVNGVSPDGKDNISLAVYNGRSLIPIGKCSTHGKVTPEQYDVVEVRYLYATNPEMPRLFQPRLVRIRTDKQPPHCTIDQVVFASKDVLS